MFSDNLATTPSFQCALPPKSLPGTSPTSPHLVTTDHTRVSGGWLQGDMWDLWGAPAMEESQAMQGLFYHPSKISPPLCIDISSKLNRLGDYEQQQQKKPSLILLTCINLTIY